jgi:hypothetical protein
MQQLCGYSVSPTTEEHAIMGGTFSAVRARNIKRRLVFQLLNQNVRGLNLAAVTCATSQVSSLTWQRELLLVGHKLLN